jgi:hypothetical protein
VTAGRNPAWLPGAALAALLVIAPLPALAQATPQPEHPTTSTDDRLLFSYDHMSLTDTNGGYGGSLNWLRNVGPSSVVGIGGEYQTIAGSHWAFGNLTGSWGIPSEHLNIYGEAHLGGGNNGHNFDYAIAAVGLVRTFASKYSLQLEDRQLHVDTTHGNLPKLGLTVLMSPQWIANLTWQHSVSGNLGTDLGAVRIDHYANVVNVLFGGAGGRASPAVVELNTGLVLPGQTLHEGFVGVSKRFSRTELQLLGDYLDLSGSIRITVTLTCTVHLQASAGAR